MHYFTVLEIRNPSKALTDENDVQLSLNFPSPGPNRIPEHSVLFFLLFKPGTPHVVFAVSSL